MSAPVSLPASMRVWLVYTADEVGQRPFSLKLCERDAKEDRNLWNAISGADDAFVVPCDLAIPDYIRWEGIDPTTWLPAPPTT